MVKIYQQPFAHAGTKQVIPDASDPQGFVSNADGFTTDYELPDTDPNYKPIERAEFNGLMNMVTESLGEIQQFGFAKWQAVDGGWPVGANVNHGGGVWQSLANANTEEPGAGTLWKPILFDKVATTAQAQAMTDDNVALTPAKLAAAFGGANQRLTANGYQKLPSGLIIQWGAASTNASGDSSVTLPISFPNDYKIILTYQGANRNNPWAAYAHTKLSSGFQIYSFITINGVGQALAINWIAIGY